MRRTLIGRMSLRPRRVRNVNTTKIPRPSPVLPIALKRSSDFECRGSGRTAIGPRNMSSIAAGETPCFWHLDRFSSQSNPAICIRVSAVTPLLSVHICTAIRQYLPLYGFQENKTRSVPNGGQPHATISRDETLAKLNLQGFLATQRDLRHYVHDVACVVGAPTIGCARGAVCS
jgi:hypothetical protein